MVINIGKGGTLPKQGKAVRRTAISEQTMPLTSPPTPLSNIIYYIYILYRKVRFEGVKRPAKGSEVRNNIGKYRDERFLKVANFQKPKFPKLSEIIIGVLGLRRPHGRFS
jgi:hypothetical protein